MHATALDICYTIYGEATLSPEVIDRYYESSASTYENPVLTATSRTVIFDIFKLGRKLHALDIPRPLAALFTLLRLQDPEAMSNPLFQAMRVWNEVGHISEHESFDGQRKAIVEHTLNILVLPEIHVDADPHAASLFAASDSLIHSRSRSSMSSPSYHPGSPSLAIPGTSFTVPSPFHFQLHIMTRLSFNEQNRITHHRDFWDVKDLMGLLPGVSFMHWIGSRIAAKGLSYTYKLLPKAPKTEATTILTAPLTMIPVYKGSSSTRNIRDGDGSYVASQP
ncbi:hypothetical protein BDZ89DRAFT_976395 [Hymenopellis radicata]|nr:hypothetical protein BDZ89DRAFT_976395 [Hymenopellis radicata]